MNSIFIPTQSSVKRWALLVGSALLVGGLLGQLLAAIPSN